MKKAIFLFCILTTLALNAQTPSTARFPGSPAGLPAGPANPGLPASAVNPGLPGFDNSFAPFFTNQFPNGLTAGNLNQLLLNLQFDLTQLWPALASANDSFEFASTGGTNVTAGSTNFFPGSNVTPGSSLTPRGPGNASTLLSGSSAANLGTSLGQDLSGIVGGRGTAASPGSPALGAASVSPALSPALAGSATNTGSALTSGFVGNGFTFTSTRDVFRALIVLQADVERMLPLVNALNGGNPTNLAMTSLLTNNVGAVNNGFFTTRPPTTTTTRTLTPTGR